MKDLSNAFGSVSWGAFDSTVEDCAKPEDWTLCKQHYRDGVIEMQGDDGTFYMKPNVGGLMGDPFIVSAFLGSFTRPTEFWSAAMQSKSGTHLLSGALPDDDEVDLSHCSYADDLHRTLLFKVGSTMHEVSAELTKADDVLDAALSLDGMKQNRDKQVTSFFFSHQSAKKSLKSFWHRAYVSRDGYRNFVCWNAFFVIIKHAKHRNDVSDCHVAICGESLNVWSVHVRHLKNPSSSCVSERQLNHP